MFNIEINNNISKITPDLPFEVANSLHNDLSYQMEGVHYSKQYRMGHWDGRTYLFNKRNQSFGSGLFSHVKKILEHYNIEYTITDKRIKPISGQPYIFTDKISLYDYQIIAEQKMHQHERGIIKVATGGGKSIIISSFIANKNVPTLIIVPRKTLLKQFHTDLSSWLNTDIGMIGDGICDPKRITIATMQSLIEAYPKAKPKGKKYSNQTVEEIIAVKTPKIKKINVENEHKYELIKKVIENVQCVIIDETHHLASSTLQFLSAKLGNAYYKFGFSATPFFSDELTKLVEKFTGKTIVDVNASTLIEKGYLSKPTIYLHEFKHTDTSLLDVVPKVPYAELYTKFVVDNDKRNELIIQLALQHVNAGNSVLIAVYRIEHGKNILNKLIPILGDKCMFIDGTNESHETMQCLDDLNHKRIMCVIATTVLGEGINVKSLDTLINARAVSSQVDTLQLTGRALRKTDTKDKVTIIDIQDKHCKYLTTHSTARKHAYETEPAFEIIKIKET